MPNAAKDKQKNTADDEKNDLSELERIKKENEELRSTIRLRDAKDEVLSELEKAGNNSPELAFKAMQGDLVFDETTGKLTNAKDLIDGFKISYPDQFGTQKPASGVDAGAGFGEKVKALTKADIEKMTPAEINDNWQEVSQSLSK